MSAPRTMGASRPMEPPAARNLASTGLVPAAITRTRTSPGPRCGFSTSRSSKRFGPPNCGVTMARTLSLLLYSGSWVRPSYPTPQPVLLRGVPPLRSRPIISRKPRLRRRSFVGQGVAVQHVHLLLVPQGEALLQRAAGAVQGGQHRARPGRVEGDRAQDGADGRTCYQDWEQLDRGLR